jgi:hypothetical protein
MATPEQTLPYIILETSDVISYDTERNHRLWLHELGQTQALSLAQLIENRDTQEHFWEFFEDLALVISQTYSQLFRYLQSEPTINLDSFPGEPSDASDARLVWVIALALIDAPIPDLINWGGEHRVVNKPLVQKLALIVEDQLVLRLDVGQ